MNNFLFEKWADKNMEVEIGLRICGSELLDREMETMLRFPLRSLQINSIRQNFN